MNGGFIGFGSKLVLTGYRRSFPRNYEMFSYLTFDLNFQVQLRSLYYYYGGLSRVKKKVTLLFCNSIMSFDLGFY
jgi:hypothetical protein